MARQQTQREEKWNAATHGLMAILVAAALPFAVWRVLSRGAATAARDASLVAVFCLCLILMFSASASYHHLPANNRFKQTLKRFDHIAIYFAIAGSYTPIAIMVVGGQKGLALLIVEWALVLAGVLFKLLNRKPGLAAEILSVTLYLAMGWGIVILFPEFKFQAETAFLRLVIAGGLFYSAGILFYAQKRHYAHVVWHFFVNAGAICHFLAIVFFIR